MGERNSSTIVWDVIHIYDPGARWNERLPDAAFSDRPVVHVIGRAAKALVSLPR
jgi:hypothetical protein